MSTWPLVATDPCCVRAMDIDMTLSDSTGQNLTMVPRWHYWCLDHTDPHDAQVSNSASLCQNPSVSLSFLYHLLALGVWSRLSSTMCYLYSTA